MKSTKKVLTFIFLSVFVLGFVLNITNVPSTAVAGGGSYCDEGASKYCWTSLPNWECRSVTGGVKCADPAVE